MGGVYANCECVHRRPIYKLLELINIRVFVTIKSKVCESRGEFLRRSVFHKLKLLRIYSYIFESFMNEAQ